MIDDSNAALATNLPNPGAAISDPTGWSVAGNTVINAVWDLGDAFVGVSTVNPPVPGDVYTYDGSGSIPLAPGTAFLS